MGQQKPYRIQQTHEKSWAKEETAPQNDAGKGLPASTKKDLECW